MAGLRCSVVTLSYGERGESGELWKEPGQTVENVKRVRREQARAAAEILGAEFHCFDLGDYPLNLSEAALEQLVAVFRDRAPCAVLTHTPVVPFNPDHPTASQAVQRARLLAAGAGVASAFKNITPPGLCYFVKKAI